VGLGLVHIRNNRRSIRHCGNPEFSTQQLCLIAARELQALTKPIVSGGIARYEVAGTCVQTSEVVTKR
jgi:hypothetical protein